MKQAYPKIYHHLQKDDLPQKAGIYTFFYNPFSPHGLGLFADKPLTDKKINRAKKTVEKKLAVLKELRFGLESDIQIDLGIPSGKRLANFHAHAYASYLDNTSKLDDLTSEEFLELLNLANRSIHALPPIYFGITIKQTLKERYIQHYANFLNNKPGTFGSRAREHLLAWEDLAFMCSQAENLNGFAKAVDTLEAQLILLSTPYLSAR